MDAEHDCGIGKIFEIIVGDPEISAGTMDQRNIGHHPSIPDKTVSENDCIPTILRDPDAALIVAGKQTFFQAETVRPVEFDA